MTERLLTVADVAARVQVDERTVRRAIDRGELDASDFAERPGEMRAAYRIAPAAVDSWEQARDERRSPEPSEPAADAFSPRGVVYFIQAGDAGAVKIGWASSEVAAWVRLEALQIGNQDQLHLRALVPGDRDEERRRHAEFADARIRGEWFTPDPKLLALIAGAAV